MMIERTRISSSKRYFIKYYPLQGEGYTTSFEPKKPPQFRLFHKTVVRLWGGVEIIPPAVYVSDDKTL